MAEDGYPRILPAYENGIFQSIFLHPESRVPLADIISSFTGIPVIDVIVHNSEVPKNDIGTKHEIFDISCSATDGKTQFEIEMQASHMEGDNSENEHANIRCRSVYNLSDLHANQNGRGINYSDLSRSYQITVCKYRPFREKHRLIEEFLLRNEYGLVLADAVRSIFVDLTLTRGILRKPVGDMTAAEMWSVFIAKSGEPKYKGLLSEITKKREAISMAQEALSSISTNPDERARYHSRKMWEMDRAHEKAVWANMAKENLDKGLLEKTIEIAQNALKEGASLDFVKKITSLDEPTVKQLKMELDNAGQ
ncbi:MAG: Rpn family recombination-promoting nuclease/putative transposase [Clostridiales bacterium]|nr:Rpn family recombination-promoting nuclease/putative transposase [Clostridiales bacterium]